ncbi:hypothetical protein [Pseudohongiella acticola]|uniref:hypothetical protein n=1 Tax=Pseudohongiella acticola TaxID=1524254 RepID=UPI0030EF2658
MTQVTVSQFFAGYMAANKAGQEFDQLTSEQRMRAQFEFIGGRAMYIRDLDFDAPEAPPRSIGAEARRILRDLEGALSAIDEGNIYAAAMESLKIGRWMERVTSGQLAHKAITFSVNSDALAAAQAKYSQSQSEKAQKRRNKVNENGETIGHIIERLARQDETAANLWQQFEYALREIGADPELKKNPREPRKSIITYFKADGAQASIKRGQFENRISEARK